MKGKCATSVALSLLFLLNTVLSASLLDRVKGTGAKVRTSLLSGVKGTGTKVRTLLGQITFKGVVSCAFSVTLIILGILLIKVHKEAREEFENYHGLTSQITNIGNRLSPNSLQRLNNDLQNLNQCLEAMRIYLPHRLNAIDSCLQRSERLLQALGEREESQRIAEIAQNILNTRCSLNRANLEQLGADLREFNQHIQELHDNLPKRLQGIENYLQRIGTILEEAGHDVAYLCHLEAQKGHRACIH